MTRTRRSILDRRQGTLAVDLTLEQLRRAAAGLIPQLRAAGLRCVVGYDTRFMANLFAARLAADLVTAGIPTTLSTAALPLPALFEALADEQADCALYVSAGNAAYYESGLQLIGAHDSGLSLQADADAAAAVFPTPVDGVLLDLRPAYLDTLRERIDLDLIRRTALTFFVDTMGGSSAGLICGLFGDGSTARAIEINRDADAWFGRAAPQPTQQPLQRLRKLVRESDSRFGVAISGDGTALALIDDQGSNVAPHDVALLIAGYLARQHRQRGSVVLPHQAAGSVRSAAGWEQASALTIEFAADPLSDAPAHALIAAAADGSIRIGRQSDVADGVLATLLLAELLARTGSGLTQLLALQRRLTDGGAA